MVPRPGVVCERDAGPPADLRSLHPAEQDDPACPAWCLLQAPAVRDAVRQDHSEAPDDESH
eukprot:7949295-Alexandrium_andersonii.AAC.1